MIITHRKIIIKVMSINISQSAILRINEIERKLNMETLYIFF